MAEGHAGEEGIWKSSTGTSHLPNLRLQFHGQVLDVRAQVRLPQRSPNLVIGFHILRVQIVSDGACNQRDNTMNPRHSTTLNTPYQHCETPRRISAEDSARGFAHRERHLGRGQGAWTLGLHQHPKGGLISEGQCARERAEIRQ